MNQWNIYTLAGDDGDPFLHDDDVVPCSGGKRLMKSTALLGYVLVEYVGGDSKADTY
jgi:hypothetical protein